jgi:ATP-dependent DNA helicase PIF1
MQRSFLWRNITVLHLHQNMRLNTNVEAEANFAKWQFEIGHGEHTDEASNISLPDQFKCRENTVSSLIDTIYPNIHIPDHSNQYFSERIILSSMNKDVNALNKVVLDRFPGPIQTFHSADFIPPSEQIGEDDPMLNYPVELLNDINGSTLPLAKLEVKAGCPVMILKNLDQSRGVCNGSRGVLTRYRSRVLEVKLITGQYAGETVFIPRVSNQPSDEENSFKFTRKQFPVRLCFAMTINKSQGQSVKHVGLDLSSSVFTHGQFYVAVSRVTSVSNIKAIWNEQQEEAVTKNIVYTEVLLNHD